MLSKADNLVSFVVIAYLLWRNARLLLSKKRDAFAVHVVDIRCISSILMLVVNCAVARWCTVMRSFLPVRWRIWPCCGCSSPNAPRAA